jgi:hypothetical protein
MLRFSQTLALCSFTLATPILAQAVTVDAGHYDCTITKVSPRTDQTIESLQIRNAATKTFEVLLYDQIEGNINRYLTLLGHENMSTNFHSDGSGNPESTQFKLFSKGTMFTIDFHGAKNPGSINLGFFDQLAQFTCSKR